MMSGLFLPSLKKIAKILCYESLKVVGYIFYVFAPQAGADIVAPSDMMDGRILAIKQVSTSLHLLTLNPHRRYPGSCRQRLRQPGLRAELRGEVLLQLLRPVPRGRQVCSSLWRPQEVPAALWVERTCSKGGCQGRVGGIVLTL